jgi:nitroreductase
MTEQSQPAGLERLRADYEAAKARLAEIGFTCEGSLIERYTSCKNPNCRCQDPDQRHGPYWQISWKQNGKTVSKILPADDAALYQEWIANRRALEAILDEMRDLSRHAAQQLLAGRGQPLHGPQRPRRRAA